MVSGDQNITHLPVYHILLASASTHYSYYWQYRGRDLWGQLKRRLSYKVSEVPIGYSIALLNANAVCAHYDLQTYSWLGSRGKVGGTDYGTVTEVICKFPPCRSEASYNNSGMPSIQHNYNTIPFCRGYKGFSGPNACLIYKQRGI